MKKLFESKLISSEEYEKSEVAVKQAREELQTAKDNLEIVKEGITKNKASFSSTLIRSTIDGLILDVPVKAGNSVIMSNTFNDGTTIATVANMNDLIFRGNIDETEVGRIHEGMPVKITLGSHGPRGCNPANIGVSSGLAIFCDVPQCIAGRNADTGVVFVGWSFRLTVCLRILRREVED